MAKLHSCCFVVASILVGFLQPSCLQASNLPSSSRTLSFELHLPRPPLNLHNATCMHQQPLTPFLFSTQPVFQFDASSLARINVGSASGLYLADPAASMELRHVFFTATLQKYQGGQIAKAEAEKINEEGSLVLMGSVGSGAVSVVGGTRAFAFASGQAKVSMAAAGSSEHLIIVFDVELQLEEEIAFL